jgi:hypothetical protein
MKQIASLVLFLAACAAMVVVSDSSRSVTGDPTPYCPPFCAHASK